MPELPEVETVTNALRPHLLGRQFVSVETFTQRLRYPLDIHEREDILRQPVISVRRRARYTLVELANQRLILMHLGMTGACRLVPPEEPREKHEHVIWRLDNGMDWRFRDPRKFGIVEVHELESPGAEPASLSHLGPEPFSDAFTGAYLYEQTRGRRGPIKPLVMNNELVVGVGNIYASEALWRARIRPTYPAGRISRERCDRLVKHIRDVLADAIAAGGSTIIDFKGVDGSEGRFSRRLDVYDREGEPCRRCESPDAVIRRKVMSGRSTFYCAGCQH